MRRVSTLLAGAAAGAFAAAVLLRRRRPRVAHERLDPRARELREKLAEARTARADEEDFEAAGMAAETAVEEPAAPPTSPAEVSEPETSKPAEPADEFEAMRRRVHEEARAAAEEMRRDPDADGDAD
ncbi:MAG TPA: hypothetical protein VK285_00840 [Gaiellaceae bacterium]|nr:hypothetical protein [Gaiellaceae bacterium]